MKSICRFGLVLALFLAFISVAYAGCWEIDPNQTLTFATEFTPNAVTEADNTYIVIPGTSMKLTNISAFNITCDNGAHDSLTTPVKVSVNDVEASNNSYACDGYGCAIAGGNVCKGTDESEPYVFYIPGTYKVKVEYATIINASAWDTAGEFTVVVINPQISINGMPSKIISFAEGETEKDATVTWTITNSGDIGIKLKDIQALGCSDSIACTFPEFVADTLIKPDEFYLLKEKIVAKRPATAKITSNLGLTVNYSDEYDVMVTEKKSWHIHNLISPALELTLVKTDKEQFHVKLDLGAENLCYGRDNMLGFKGSEVLPKVKFAWGWDSIAIDTCDKNNSNAVYCDATQLGISLMKRIELIENLLADGNYDGAETYKHFSAYLTKDGYSEDFQADFSNYFQNAFFGASSWFASGDTAFANIFEDPARFVFTTSGSTTADPREKVKPLAEPGLYKVDIAFVYDNPDITNFFSGGNPNVSVKAYFTFVKKPINDNPFYYLPFNGSIGMEEGVYARDGYGLGYEGAELLISQTALESIKTAASAPGNTIATTKYTDFDTINKTYSGSVLIASKDFLSLLPSDATPVLMRVKENNGYADAFYNLREGDNRFGTNADYMASWNGIASNMGCRDFSGNVLFKNRRDYLADNITHHAALEPSDIGDSAFGFSWESADTDSELFAQSILYTPIGSTIDLFPAYSGNPLFVSPVEQITETTKPIRLNYTSAVLNNGEPIITSIEDIFELAKEDKLCIASSAENIDFYWNPEFISEALKPYSDEVNEILCSG